MRSVILCTCASSSALSGSGSFDFDRFPFFFFFLFFGLALLSEDPAFPRFPELPFASVMFGSVCYVSILDCLIGLPSVDIAIFRRGES